MGKLLNADYRQKFLFAPTIENWVPDDHPVRLIRELIEHAIERGGLDRDTPNSEEGRPEYAPSLLLKIWVYAYMLRLRSTRKAEWACKNVLPMVWLAGGLHPDHNTLSRFWHEHRRLVADFFRMTLGLALDLNMVGMVLQAVDGTKMQACASTSRALNQPQAEALRERVERTIVELEEQIATNDAPEVGDESKLGHALRDRKRLKSAIDAAITSWTDPRQKRALSEPDARMLIGAGIGYNAQAVVDAKHGIMVAQDVVTDANDQHQLVPMLDKVHEELGRVAEQTVADGGYNTAQGLAEAAEREYEVIVNRSADERKGEKAEYHASHFLHDVAEDVVICPQNRKLEFVRVSRRSRQPYPVRVYRGVECGQCPVRASCTSSVRGRVIEISPHHQAVLANRRRREDAQNKKRLASRITFGERPFAVIKELLGIRRFRLKGRAGAALEWSFIGGVYNLLMLLRGEPPILGPARVL